MIRVARSKGPTFCSAIILSLTIFYYPPLKRFVFYYCNWLPVYFEIYRNGQSKGRVLLKTIVPRRKPAEPYNLKAAEDWQPCTINKAISIIVSFRTELTDFDFCFLTIFRHLPGGFLAGAHRCNNGGSSGHNIPSGKDPGQAGLQGLLIHLDITSII